MTVHWMLDPEVTPEDYESAADLTKQLQDAEKERRRIRTEQGRSPAQKTSRSTNKGREAKRPGKSHRKDWEKEEEK